MEQASGTMPRRANTKPKRADSAAMRMSIGSCMVTPTPTAAPLTAAIIGLLSLKMRRRQQPAAVALPGRALGRGRGGCRRS